MGIFVCQLLGVKKGEVCVFLQSINLDDSEAAGKAWREAVEQLLTWG